MEYTRVYKYTNSDNNHTLSNKKTYPFSANPNALASGWTIDSGDTTHSVTKIISVTAQTMLYVGTNQSKTYCSLKCGFVSGGSEIQASRTATWQTSPGSHTTLSVSWDSSLTAAFFNAATSFTAQGNASGLKPKDHPIYLTVVFESEIYKPSITEFNIERVTAAGVVDPVGLYVKYSYQFTTEMTTTEETSEYPSLVTIADAEGNVLYALSGITNLNSKIDVLTSGTYTAKTYGLGSQHEFILSITYHGETVTEVFALSSVFVNFSLRKDDRGAAFGTFAEQDRFIVDGYEAEFRAGIKGVTNIQPGVIEDTGGWWIVGDSMLRIMREWYVIEVTSTGTFNTGISIGGASGFTAILRLSGTIFQQGRYWNQMGWNVNSEDFNLAVANGQLQIYADKVGTAYVEVLYVEKDGLN